MLAPRIRRLTVVAVLVAALRVSAQTDTPALQEATIEHRIPATVELGLRSTTLEHRVPATVGLGLRFATIEHRIPSTVALALRSSTIEHRLVPLAVAAGPANPGSADVTPGRLGVPVLQLSLRGAAPGRLLTLSSLRLAASGSLNDPVHVAALHLYVDENADGAVQAGEAVLATTTISGDNGVAAFEGLSREVPSGQSVALLVTADLAGSAPPDGTFALSLASPADVGGLLDGTTAVAGAGTPVAGATITVVPADSAPPTVTIDAPLDGETFFNAASITPLFSAADEAGGSGLRSVVGVLDGTTEVQSGTPLTGLALGTHTLAVTARDRAGNLRTAGVTFFLERFAAGYGPAHPASAQVPAGTANVTLGQFRLDRRGSPVAMSLVSVGLVASGSGDDTNLSRVALVRDVDSDGVADPGEPVLALGRFPQDDGALFLSGFTSDLPANGAADFVVVCDFSGSEGYLDRFSIALASATAVAEEEAVQPLGLPLGGRLVVVEDVTPPVVEILAPPDGSSLPDNGFLALSFTAVDDSRGSGVALIQADLDGAPVMDGQFIELATLAVGEHRLTVIARDGAGNEGRGVSVFRTVHPQQALQDVANGVQGVIDDPDTPAEAKPLLQEALDLLVGNNGGRSGNGAITLMYSGDVVAGMVKIQQAIRKLRQAADRGAATVELQRDLAEFLGQTMAARVAHLEELIAADPTLDPEGKIVQIRTFMSQGDTAFAAENYENAVFNYRQAQQRILDLDREVPVLTLVEPGGLLTNDTTPRLRVQYLDLLGLIQTLGARIFLDGGEFTSSAQIGPFEMILDVALPLSEGEHTVRVVVMDSAGNVADETWTFRIDVTPPRVLSVSPPDGATGVLPNDPVVLLFSEPMDPSTLAEPNVTVFDGFTTVSLAFEVSPDQTVLTIRRSGPWRLDTLHTLRVTQGAQDPAANALAAAFASAFYVGYPPGAADSDADGMPDDYETRFGLDPQDGSDATGDLDGDGLSNGDEYRFKTYPTISDSDGDGLLDGTEVEKGMDPTDSRDVFRLESGDRVRGSLIVGSIVVCPPKVIYVEIGKPDEPPLGFAYDSPAGVRITELFVSPTFIRFYLNVEAVAPPSRSRISLGDAGWIDVYVAYFSLEFDVPETPGAGALVVYNNDDDDLNSQRDLDQSVVSGEQDLVNVTLRASPEGLPGTMTLLVLGAAGDVKFYESRTKGDPFVPGTPVPADTPKDVWMEGRQVSLVPGVVQLFLVYEGGIGMCLDEAQATCVGVSLFVDDPRTVEPGQVFDPENAQGTDERDTWLPEGQPDAPGSVQIIALIHDARLRPIPDAEGATVTFGLKDVSAWPGYCINAGEGTDPDMTFQDDTTNHNPQTVGSDGTARTTLKVKDWAASCKLMVEWNGWHPPGIEGSHLHGINTNAKDRVPLPQDDENDGEGDGLFDQWERQTSSALGSFDPTKTATYSDRETGQPIPDKAYDLDEDRKSFDDDQKGDGFSAFEEMRGAQVQGRVRRFNELEDDTPTSDGGLNRRAPFMKDAFVAARDVAGTNVNAFKRWGAHLTLYDIYFHLIALGEKEERDNSSRLNWNTPNPLHFGGQFALQIDANAMDGESAPAGRAGALKWNDRSNFTLKTLDALKENMELFHDSVTQESMDALFTSVVAHELGHRLTLLHPAYITQVVPVADVNARPTPAGAGIITRGRDAGDIILLIPGEAVDKGGPKLISYPIEVRFIDNGVTSAFGILHYELNNPRLQADPPILVRAPGGVPWIYEHWVGIVGRPYEQDDPIWQRVENGTVRVEIKLTSVGRLRPSGDASDGNLNPIPSLMDAVVLYPRREPDALLTPQTRWIQLWGARSPDDTQEEGQ